MEEPQNLCKKRKNRSEKREKNEEHKEKKDKEKEQKGSHSKENTPIDWPNSLTIVPSGVANCRNLPFGERATQGLKGASSNKEKRMGVATNVYLRKTIEKPKRVCEF